MTRADQAIAGVAVITGAASGMGAAAVRLMRDAGWPVVLCDLDAGRLRQTAEDLGAEGRAETLAGDIADAGFADRLSAALGERRVGALIHCAGLSPTMAEPARILEVNLAATMRLVDAVLPRMSEGGAAILFASVAAYALGATLDEPISKVATPEAVASLLAFAPDSGAAYVVSKRGVQLLAQRAAQAFGRHGARIVSLSPGIIDTPMGRAEMASQPVMKAMVDNSALRRPARPEEVAAVAAFLCSPAASFISGVDILVDGGSIASARFSAA